MINREELRQAWTIARLEMRRAFFSKRSFWIYILALFPAFIFVGHGIEVKYKQQRFGSRGVITAQEMDSITKGENVDQLVRRLPKTVEDHEFTRRERRGPDNDREEIEHRTLQYFDGKRRAWVFATNGVVQEINIGPLANFEEDREAF